MLLAGMVALTWRATDLTGYWPCSRPGQAHGPWVTYARLAGGLPG